MSSSTVIEYDSIETPIGFLQIVASQQAVLTVEFTTKQAVIVQHHQGKIISAVKNELQEYFSGRRQNFTVPLAMMGSEFQIHNWQYLQKIAYGETVCYQDQAQELGNKKAVRAVARANAHNKHLVLIPCHRVIAKNGSIAGYSAGIERKEWLLKHEEKYKFATGNN